MNPKKLYLKVRVATLVVKLCFIMIGYIFNHRLEQATNLALYSVLCHLIDIDCSNKMCNKIIANLVQLHNILNLECYDSNKLNLNDGLKWEWSKYFYSDFPASKYTIYCPPVWNLFLFDSFGSSTAVYTECFIDLGKLNLFKISLPWSKSVKLTVETCGTWNPLCGGYFAYFCAD